MGATEVEHLVDFEEPDYAEIGLKKIEIKCLMRVLSDTATVVTAL